MNPSLTAIAVILNVLLIAIAAGLIYRHLHRRALQTAELRSQKQRLENEVVERTRELAELSTHLQSVSERDKASLARELHDELGGLLVGARMDISWAEQHLGAADIDLKQRLNRVQQNLSASIDLKRRIIEELRPTLLDNVGFIAALRWQMKETCVRAGLACNEYFPDEEPKLTSDAAISLFRIAQESFANILRMGAAKTVDVTLDVDDDSVVFRISDNGRGISDPSFQSDVHILASMRHRVRALRGTFDVSGSSTGGILEVRLPVSLALREISEPEPLRE
ncbi:MAG TPA: histidine kinase [Steroidobacteraceae bacterium]|jgi:signal transduction histidine kinase|nr:histidine kinase [Steroidobacteraceae bacterium]